MKLEVGMYVRTKDGKIDKILKLNDSYVKGVSQKYELYCYDKENIIKASHRIIDLIQVGDYVNGGKVNEIVNGKPFHEEEDPYYSYGWENEDIETIVTKEQFESIEYEVSEGNKYV